MTEDPPTRIPDAEDMSPGLTSSLLRLGLSRHRRPVDDLIDRLEQPDGPAWLALVLTSVVDERVGPRAALAEGQAGIDELRGIKERSKRKLGQAVDQDGRLAGIAGYFLAIAAGLRHHGLQVGGRGRAELDPILLDLAAAAPPPYDDLLADATMVKG